MHIKLDWFCILLIHVLGLNGHFVVDEVYKWCCNLSLVLMIESLLLIRNGFSMLGTPMEKADLFMDHLTNRKKTSHG